VTAVRTSGSVRWGLKRVYIDPAFFTGSTLDSWPLNLANSSGRPSVPNDVQKNLDATSRAEGWWHSR